jgi:hypothetical protein
VNLLRVSGNMLRLDDHLCDGSNLRKGDAERAKSPDRAKEVSNEHFDGLFYA